MPLSCSYPNQDQLSLNVNEASLDLLAALRKASLRAFRPLGFTQLEAMVLIFVERGHTQSTDLAQLLGVLLPSVSAMTAKLVDLGLVTKEVVPNDNRFILLGLTAKGRLACRDIRVAWRAHSPIDTSDFTVEEISAFIRISQTFTH